MISPRDALRQRVTELRLQAGVSEYQLSLALGQSKGYIQQISSGKAMPSMPEKFYSYNAYEHTGSYTFTGVPGVKYRAVMKAYAEDENGSEYSKEFTCTGRVCK